MQSDPLIIKHLNKALGNELIAINQYFLHAKMLQDWGFKKLGDLIYKESIDEMKHAEQLTDRILFLNGLPNLQELGKLYIGQTIKEIFECDLKLEMQALPILKEGIAYAEKMADYPSRDLLCEIMRSEESHIDWIETQLDLLNRLGETAYLQLQV